MRIVLRFDSFSWISSQRKTFQISDKSENDLKALQSVGQIVGEVLRQLTDDNFIVKATNGPRYVVGCRRQLDKSKLKPGTRVALDMTTLTIMRYLVHFSQVFVHNSSSICIDLKNDIVFGEMPQKF